MTQKDLLQFWRNIEIFHLPDLPKSEPVSFTFPWDEHRMLKDKRNVWRYTLYLGKVSKQKVVDYLKDILKNRENEDWLEPVTGFTYLAALVLDSDGCPDWNSYIQASFIQGIRCLLDQKPLTKVKELLDQSQSDFETRLNISKSTPQDIEEGNPRKGSTVTRKILKREFDELKNILGLFFPVNDELFFSAAEVSPDAEIDATFLNSFYLDDLNYLLKNTDKWGNAINIGNALNRYLSLETNSTERLDLIENKQALLECLDPSKLSPGRWPTKIDYSLYTAQQGAVNSSISELTNQSGILGINGPPGTGKTTLLLDVIANVIVSRAEQLINTPVNQIFKNKTENIETETGFKHYYSSFNEKAKFDGYGIVVSSNNNAAVANITKELPASHKIDLEVFEEEANYFAECASRLLDQKEAWGILSAPLGSGQNIREFKTKFWQSGGTMQGFNQLLKDAYSGESNKSEYIEIYNEVKKELEDLLTEFRQFQKTASDVHSNLFTYKTPSGFSGLISSTKNTSLKSFNAAKQKLIKQYGINSGNIIDENFLQKDHIAIHLSTPYSSAQLNELRSRILLRSLELHKYAILVNAKQVRNNLTLFFEMLKGKLSIPNDVCLTLWNSFFFCVPVVSTTLASSSRLFRHLGKESIGWLLLDEAGQATPQSVAGILWRSKRAIVVGDPLQIKPVVSHPEYLIRTLRKESQINDIVWSPLASSAQSLADRISEKGTYLTNNEDDARWSGFPLRTHLRCDNPMFDIANRIAYDRQMVKARNDEPFKCVLGESCWFDVRGTSIENKHVVVEEIECLNKMITDLNFSDYHDEIFIISPFRSIKNACEEIFKKHTKIKCGTIHTFQGQEAKIVFLILGSDPAKPGARNWVTETPNMLNVAVTRAQKRFFMIGNVKLWGHLDFIDEFKKTLPVVKM